MFETKIFILWSCVYSEKTAHYNLFCSWKVTDFFTGRTCLQEFVCVCVCVWLPTAFTQCVLAWEHKCERMNAVLYECVPQGILCVWVCFPWVCARPCLINIAEAWDWSVPTVTTLTDSRGWPFTLRRLHLIGHTLPLFTSPHQSTQPNIFYFCRRHAVVKVNKNKGGNWACPLSFLAHGRLFF